MSESDMGIQLELKDRLPYANYLDQQLRSFEQSLGSDKTSTTNIQLKMLSLFNSIPDSWKDEDFENELKKCIKIRKIDIRPRFGGKPRSVEYCKRKGIPIVKNVRQIDYFKLKRTIINLLDGLQMLIRREKIERSTGRNLNIETIEELEQIYLEDIEDEEVDENGKDT